MVKTKTGILVIVSVVGVLLSIIIMSTPACSATFKGQLIDADSREPIEGAVVVLSWHEERPTPPSGGGTRLKDVKETLTDKDGKWSIDGPKGRKLGNFLSIVSFLTRMYITKPPQFIIFKPGYCSWPKGLFVESCKEKIKYELDPQGHYKLGEGETIELPKLTNREERKKNSSISLPDDKNMKKKLINLIKLLSEEDAYLYPGLQEKSMYKELLREFNYEK
ncbi:MAG: hypothetical protein M0R70_00300 [Nitrospirae bacterium]|nr:hypothetical protein [Nitrospirota bacterium]